MSEGAQYDKLASGLILPREFVPVDDETFAVRTTQDVEPILDLNKALQTDGDGYSKSRELRHYASIPLVVAEKWMNEHGVDVFNPNHKPAVRRLLESNEYSYLRTSGRSSRVAGVS